MDPYIALTNLTDSYHISSEGTSLLFVYVEASNHSVRFLIALHPQHEALGSLGDPSSGVSTP